jgi:hypothetical protein
MLPELESSKINQAEEDATYDEMMAECSTVSA